MQVRFRGAEKKVLAKVTQDIVESLEHEVKTSKKKPLNIRLKVYLKEDKELVAYIVAMTAVYVVTNIDKIPTKKLEGLVEGDKVISESVKEVTRDLTYVS